MSHWPFISMDLDAAIERRLLAEKAAKKPEVPEEEEEAEDAKEGKGNGVREAEELPLYWTEIIDGEEKHFMKPLT